MKRDSTGFWRATNPEGEVAWFDDPNVPMRAVAQRAPNRFQAYQRHEDEMLSMGYIITPNDVRRFLNGGSVELYNPDDAEPTFDPGKAPVWNSQTLDKWIRG